MLAAYLPLILFGVFAGAPILDDSNDASSDAGAPDPDAPVEPIPDTDADPDPDPGAGPDPGAEPAPSAFDATIAVDGGAPIPVEPGQDLTGTATLTGSEGDDTVTVNPDAAADLSITPGDGADTVSAGVFHSVDAQDSSADTVDMAITAPAIEAAATDAVPAADDGFIARLDPEDQVTLNIAEDVVGSVLAIEYETTDTDPSAQTETIDYGLAFYLLPPDTDLPQGGFIGPESVLIETLGLQRLGEIDLGQLSLSVNTEDGIETTIDDTRQTQLPQVLANRDIAVLNAIFAAPVTPSGQAL